MSEGSWDPTLARELWELMTAGGRRIIFLHCYMTHSPVNNPIGVFMQVTPRFFCFLFKCSPLFLEHFCNDSLEVLGFNTCPFDLCACHLLSVPLELCLVPCVPDNSALPFPMWTAVFCRLQIQLCSPFWMYLTLVSECSVLCESEPCIHSSSVGLVIVNCSLHHLALPSPYSQPQNCSCWAVTRFI